MCIQYLLMRLMVFNYNTMILLSIQWKEASIPASLEVYVHFDAQTRSLGSLKSLTSTLWGDKSASHASLLSQDIVSSSLLERLQHRAHQSEVCIFKSFTQLKSNMLRSYLLLFDSINTPLPTENIMQSTCKRCNDKNTILTFKYPF